jgi:hypothetical protein
MGAERSRRAGEPAHGRRGAQGRERLPAHLELYVRLPLPGRARPRLRKRIKTNLHDSAQQRLAALRIKLE